MALRPGGLIEETLSHSVIGVKSTLALPKAAPRQLFNDLRASKLKVGLFLHFGPEAHFDRLISASRASRSSVHSPDPLDPAHSHLKSESLSLVTGTVAAALSILLSATRRESPARA